MGPQAASLSFVASAIVSFAACAVVRQARLPGARSFRLGPTAGTGRPLRPSAALRSCLASSPVLPPADRSDFPPPRCWPEPWHCSSSVWYDDLAPLSALAKMVNSLAVAAFFVLTLSTFESTPAHAALTMVAIVWFAGVDNAVNLLDNMDGLAAGVTAIAALGLAFTFSVELGPVLVVIPLALAGALLGFLGWNRHPAKLFMGNCGSLAIGGLLAATALTAVVRAGTVTAAAAAMLILIVPLVDTTFVVLLRRLAGRSTTRGNVDHLSHRLVSAGFSEVGAVGVLYAIGMLGAVAAYFVHVHGSPPGPWSQPYPSAC